MKPGFLKSSTAMVLVASLAAAPIPSFAQTADGDAAQSEDTDADLLRQQLEEANQGETDAPAEVEAEGALDAVPDAAQADPAPDGETAPEAAETEAAPEVEPAPEAAETETAPEVETAPEAAETEAAPEVEPAPEAAETEVAPEAEPAPEAAETEVAPEAEPAPEAAETEPAPEDDAAGETAAEEPAPETEATPEATADAPAESDNPADSESDTAADTDVTTPEAVSEAETTAEDGTAEVDAEATASTEDAAPMDSEAQAEIQAEADAEAPAAMAASEAGGEGEPEVVEETVTEDTARSSNEEFSTDLQGEARAETKAKKKDDDDDNKGLSNFEKAALLGIGAVAVGAMLRNNETVAANTGDRIVAEQNGQYRVIKNDDALLRQPGSDIKTYNYSDGSTRTIVLREDGTQVETIRAADGRVLRRARTLPDGSTALLFDDTQSSQAVEVSNLPRVSTRRSVDIRDINEDDLAATLTAAQAANVNRTFSLSQIRNINAVRQLVPEINVDSVNFETNSAVIRPEEAEELAALGNAMRRMIERNPSEVFLVEGHTDAVGAGSYNLALSDRRAESVALALTEYFDVPPENLVVQGYGESDLIVRTSDAERANRRAAVRRITPLLDGSQT